MGTFEHWRIDDINKVLTSKNIYNYKMCYIINTYTNTMLVLQLYLRKLRMHEVLPKKYHIMISGLDLFYIIYHNAKVIYIDLSYYTVNLQGRQTFKK